MRSFSPSPHPGAQRIAMRRNGVLNYILGDHLGSATIIADANGAKVAEMLYKPWGEQRYASGTMPTDRRFTGQKLESSLGLYDYGARWYDPYLNHWTQPDSIIPDPGNSADFDRYAYVRNSPVRYTDPSGHKTCDGETVDDCDDGIVGYDGSKEERYYATKNWGAFERLYDLTIDPTLSPQAKLAIYAAVFAVSQKLASVSTANDTAAGIFRTIFGSMEFVVRDVALWGYTVGSQIQLDPTINWGNQYIVNFLVHEIGHSFAQNIRDKFYRNNPTQAPYSQLAGAYADANAAFPIRPDGFAGGQMEWQWSENSGRDGHSDEFADMFLGWVFGEWADNQAGIDRANWMDQDNHMPLWLDVIY